MTAYDYLSLVQGALVTVSISLAGIAIGLPLGLALALVRWTRLPGLSPLVAAYVSLLRAAPAVTLCLLVFFAVPMAGIPVSAVAAGIITLTLSTSAFNCEIWRGALMAFPKDQIEAAASVGMTAWQRLRLIILPQIARSALPALVSEMTLLVKTSPAIAVLGLVDITRAATRIGARTYDPLPPFLVALVLYSLIVFVFVRTQRILERRQQRDGALA